MAEMDDTTSLFYALSAARLRSRAQWAALVLVFSILLPYEVIDGTPQWSWQIFGELPLAAVIAAIAPTLAGIAILLSRRFTERSTSLGFAVLASLATAAAAIKIGADAAAWDVLRLPSSFTERPTFAVLAMALAGAAANLTFKAHARKASRWLFAAAGAAAAVWYLWPARGEAPLTTLFRAFRHIDDLPNVRYQIGLVTIALFVLWPLFVVLFSLVHLKWPARGEQSIAGLFATFGMPAWIVFLVYRAVIMAAAQVEAITMLGAAALLAAVLALLTASCEVLVDAITSPPQIEGNEMSGVASQEAPGLTWKHALAASIGASALVLVAQTILALPPKKGVEWKLNPPTRDAEKLFAELVPTWSDAHLAWSVKLRMPGAGASGAEELVAAKGAAREVDSAARGVDAGLATALSALTHQDDLDVAGRRWYRLVAEVNEASRKAGVPFYLDPSVRMWSTKDGLVRTFRVSSYRIEAVHPVKVGGRDFATLQVRALGPVAGHGARLGFSRDLQPFALVVLDVIEREEADDRALVEKDDPRCGGVAFDLDVNHALSTCGKALRAIIDDPKIEFRQAITEQTERHELQHQVDGPHLPLSSQVLSRMTGYAESAQRQANRELSAYVAELTSKAPPKLGILHLVPFALIARGGPEHHVAVILLSALTKRPIPQVDREEGVDPKPLAEALDELLAMDDAEIRARAAALWKNAFGRSLPEVTP